MAGYKPHTPINRMKKFLVQASDKDGSYTVTQDPWVCEEAESAEFLAEKYLAIKEVETVKVLPYEPQIYGRGVKRLNPMLGMGCKTSADYHR